MTTPHTMLARYPDGHERAGQMITRTKKCAKGHVTEQKGISSEWFASKTEGAQQLYSKDYEKDSKGRYWMPRQCALCRGRA